MKNHQQFIRWELHPYGDADIIKAFHVLLLLTSNSSEDIKKTINETVYEEIREIRDPKTCHVQKWPRYVTYHSGSEHITNYETGTITYQIVPQTDFSQNNNSLPIHHKFLFSQSISSDKSVVYNLNMDISITVADNVHIFHLHFLQERKQKKMIPFFEPWRLYSVSYSLPISPSVYDIYNKLQSIVATIFHEFHEKMTIDLVSSYYWSFFESAYHFQKGINHGNLMIVS